MTAKELRELANQTLEKRLIERPLELRDDLMGRMQNKASYGYFYLDFVFSDSKEIVEKTIELLKEEGFKVSKLKYEGVIRFEW
jgi:Fe-S oxidoreductase